MPSHVPGLDIFGTLPASEDNLAAVEEICLQVGHAKVNLKITEHLLGVLSSSACGCLSSLAAGPRSPPKSACGGSCVALPGKDVLKKHQLPPLPPTCLLPLGRPWTSGSPSWPPPPPTMAAAEARTPQAMALWRGRAGTLPCASCW